MPQTPQRKLGRIGRNGTRERFRIVNFTNRSGSTSFRVQGMKRDGTYVRDNFPELAQAHARQVELATEWLGQRTDTIVRATKLTDEQLHAAEAAFIKLPETADLLLAVDHWLKHGKNTNVAESPRLDEAVKAFCGWLATNASLRARTKENLSLVARLFARTTPNVCVADITLEVVERWLESRKVSVPTKHNNNSGLRSFFEWCIERPRRWMTSNPSASVKIELPERTAPPVILTLSECEALLTNAGTFLDGRFESYVVLGLFGGLRPDEAKRLRLAQVNVEDCEINLEGWQTKTGRPRTVLFKDGPAAQKPYNAAMLRHLTLVAGRTIWMPKWKPDFVELRRLAGITHWTPDVMRHTAISHFFRLTGSYGLTAEKFGNSERIIKDHYQGRVSTAETKKLYAL